MWITSTPLVSNLNPFFNWVDTVQTGDDPFYLSEEVNEQGERDSGLILTLISPHTPHVHYI